MFKQNRFIKRIAFFLLLAASMVVGPQSFGDALYQPCVACHGADGQGNPALGAPALAGQQAAYIARQLGHFRDGRRGVDPVDTYGAQMRAMSLNLTDEQIETLGLYLSQLPVAPVSPAGESDAARLGNGSDYYQANCGACHGGKAQGNAALNAPSLVLLDSVYLLRQMKLFQSGVRGASKEDRFGRQMQLMSNTLPSQSVLDDVIAFIGSLSADVSGAPAGS